MCELGRKCGGKYSILLVDDRAENLLALESVLEDPDLNIIKANSGQEALWKLLEHDFALILLDVQMPEMDGFEAAALIRRREKTRYIPIIFVTGISKEPRHIFRGYEAGAVDYLMKPLEPEILKSKVRVFLELHKQRRLIQTQADVLRRHELELQKSHERLEIKVRERTAELSLANKVLREEVLKRKQTEAALKDLAAQLKASNENLARLTIIDPLTRLLNRRGLQQVLSNELRQLERRNDKELLAALIDLDNFKRINDTLGHAVGDVVLKEVALKLKAAVRTGDHVSRIGGDEFLVLLPQTKLSEGLRVAERIRLAISDATIMLPSGSVKATASLGLVKASRETPSVDELLSKMHCVLHRSKKEGKNRVSSEWRGSILPNGKNRSQSDMLKILRSGDKLRTLYQPIFRLRDGTAVGYELLSRLSLPGFEMPDDFFRFCLEANILTLVDHQCLKKCIAASSLLPDRRRYHINIFPSTIIDIPVEHLLEAFPAGRERESYCLEISEQQIIGDPAHLLKPVNALRKAGISIAIDDVGFGHSCLESLVLLQPDIIKIDRRCVNGIADDPARLRSFERLLNVADALCPHVIVEGIESGETLELLKELGVRYGQGFLWGKPAGLAAQKRKRALAGRAQNVC